MEGRAMGGYDTNIGTSKLFHISKLDYQEFGLSVLDRKNYAWTL
jgi:hypothetical protein